jgi:transposase IS116/IS110/IS902 family protein
MGPIRSALAVALIQTPHRFRTKRQLWTYSGLGLETRDSGEYHYVDGQVQRRKKQAFVPGLNKDHNHDLKGLFKAVQSGCHPGECEARTVPGFLPAIAGQRYPADHGASHVGAQDCSHYVDSLEEGENFDAEKLKVQAA